jgi:hypothetical protein
VPRRLGCGQNPLPQNPSYFQNTLSEIRNKHLYHCELVYRRRAES